MTNIVINESSKLYKFFDLVRQTPLGGIMINTDTNDGMLNTFNDICTFVRHLLMTVFILIPVQLLVVCIAIYLIFMGVIYLPAEALYYIFIGYEQTPIGISAIYGYSFIIIFYLVLCVIQSIGRISITIPAIKISDDNPFTTAAKIVSQKHSAFCQRLTVRSIAEERYDKEHPDHESESESEKNDSK